MSHDYFAPSGVPRFNAIGSSAAIRGEFAAIGTAFNRLAPLAGNALRLIQVNAAGSAQQVVTDFTVADVKAMLDGAGAGIFSNPIQVALVDGLSGVFTGSPSDTFLVDTNKVVANYGLTWKRFSDVAAGPVAALSGFGGLRFYCAGAERIRIDTDSIIRIGPGGTQRSDVWLRDDSSYGSSLVFSNRRQDGARHRMGAVLFDAWRDVADPSVVAGFWCDGVSPVGNSGDLVFGAMQNGTANLPTERLRIAGPDGAVYPGADNAQVLGTHMLRWNVVYAASGSINTSDAREKTPVAPMSEAEIAAARDLAAEIGSFQFLDALRDKGPLARRHVGMTVQRAIEVMRARGLDPMRYGFICHDHWPATETRPAGDRYGFRVDELLLFIARGFDARLAALEARLGA